MAHNLTMNKTTGKMEMAYVGETPWHGLGQKVEDNLSPQEMLKAANLDWEVKRVPLRGSLKVGGKTINIPSDRKALVRMDTYENLSDVTGNWNPIQNSEAFEVFDDIIKAGHMKMHTAGSIKGGRIVWALAKIEDSFDVVKGDTVESYMLFSNPHLYGWSATARFTGIRVVCNNTLTMALSEKIKSDKFLTIGHRKHFNVEEVKEVMGIAHSNTEFYRDSSKFLASKRYTKEKLDEFFNSVFPRTSDAKGKNEPSKMFARAHEVLSEQPGAEFAEGSWWQAFNASTYILDHEIGKLQDNRLLSSWFGKNRVNKLNAMQKALELAA